MNKLLRSRLVVSAILLGCGTFTQAEATEAKPVEALRPVTGTIRLDEAGVYELGYAYRKGDEKVLQQGWEGTFEPNTGVASKAMGVQGGKKSWLLHVPWRGGVGRTYQQWSVAVPEKNRLLLRGAVAMRETIVEKSDGVTFRVLAGVETPEVLWEQHHATADWLPFEVDLSRFAGQTVRLRFEVNPGAKWNAAYDYSLWGDRELVVEAAK